jgi:hypothetical protein
MDRLRAAYRVSVIIGLAMVASLLVYTTIVGIMETEPDGPRGAMPLSGSELESVKFAQLGISAVIFFLIRFVNTRILNADGEQGKMPDPRHRSAAGIPPEFGRLGTADRHLCALRSAGPLRPGPVLPGKEPFGFSYLPAHLAVLLCRLFPQVQPVGRVVPSTAGSRSGCRVTHVDL